MFWSVKTGIFSRKIASHNGRFQGCTIGISNEMAVVNVMARLGTSHLPFLMPSFRHSVLLSTKDNDGYLASWSCLDISIQMIMIEKRKIHSSWSDFLCSI